MCWSVLRLRLLVTAAGTKFVSDHIDSQTLYKYLQLFSAINWKITLSTLQKNTRFRAINSHCFAALRYQVLGKLELFCEFEVVHSLNAALYLGKKAWACL